MIDSSVFEIFERPKDGHFGQRVVSTPNWSSGSFSFNITTLLVNLVYRPSPTCYNGKIAVGGEFKWRMAASTRPSKF